MEFLGIPLNDNSKIPAIKNWTSILPKLKLDWFNHTNFGIITGKANDILVIDVDVKHGGMESLKILNLPETYTVCTATGGLHLYYKYPDEEIRNSASKLLPGIDIRGEGGQVVGPGSIIDGMEYFVDKDLPIAKLPKAIIDHLKKSTKEKTSTSTSTYDDDVVIEGSRNDYLTKVAGTLRRSGLCSEAIEQALLAENYQRLAPPLDESEVSQIVNSIHRYEPEEPLQPESQILPVQDLLDSMHEYLADKEQVKGLSTGIEGIDRLLGGGKRLGEITVLHAEAKTGKNTLYHFMMHKWLKRGIPIGYASRELIPDREVLPNLLSIEFNKNAWIVDLDRTATEQAVRDWPLYFAKGYGYMPINSIKDWIEALYNKGVRYFFFDHLHYMLEDEDFKLAAKLIKELKTLAISKLIHIDLIIQPTKIMQGQNMGLGSLKGGSAIGQAIDNLFILSRHKQENNISILRLEKSRSKLTKPGEIYLEYCSETTSFREMEPIVEDRDTPRSYEDRF